MNKNDAYLYRNILANCPICGCALSASDIECPACEINLVGYNEEYNRTNTMRKCAERARELANQNQKINNEIRRENANRHSLLSIFKLFVKIVIFMVLSAFVVGAIVALFFNIRDGMNSMTYAEVVEYFKTFDEPNVQVDAYSIPQFDDKNKLTYNNGTVELTVMEGYDQDLAVSFIKEIAVFGDKEYAITRALHSDIAHLPKVNNSYGTIRYYGEYTFISFEDEFVQMNNANADEYVLNKYVSDTNNFITKMPCLEIDGTLVSLYWVSRPHHSTLAQNIVGVVEVGDDVLFASKISVNETSSIEMVLKSIDEYFHIQTVTGG